MDRRRKVAEMAKPLKIFIASLFIASLFVVILMCAESHALDVKIFLQPDAAECTRHGAQVLKSSLEKLGFTPSCPGSNRPELISGGLGIDDHIC